MKKFGFKQFQLNNPEELPKTETSANGDIIYYGKTSEGDYSVEIRTKSNGYTYQYG